MSSEGTPGVTAHRDVPFHETPERTLSLDVFEPVESGPRPAVLFVHGGGFVEGYREELEEYARAFADRGYVTAQCEYRVADEATFPAAVVDVKAAIEWLRAEGDAHGVDPSRVAAVGWSAGGNLAALAAVTADEPGFEPDAYPGTSSALQAMVGYAGNYDFGLCEELLDRHVDYLGGTPEERPTAYELASPAGQASVETPPTLLVHGADDAVVSVAHSEAFYRELDAVTDAAFDRREGADHQFPMTAVDETVETTAAFLQRHL